MRGGRRRLRCDGAPIEGTGTHVLNHECGAGTQRWQVGSGGAGGDGAADASQREALRLEVARLCNATSHLERSNDELKAALAADPSDQDFKDALGVGMLVPHGRIVSEWSGGWKSMPSIVKLRAEKPSHRPPGCHGQKVHICKGYLVNIKARRQCRLTMPASVRIP